MGIEGEEPWEANGGLGRLGRLSVDLEGLLRREGGPITQGTLPRGAGLRGGLKLCCLGVSRYRVYVKKARERKLEQKIIRENNE